MSRDVYSTINTRATPQTERADERQVKNSAGGYTFALDDEARLRRFLVLGSEGGTYYASARDLTLDNFEVVKRMAKSQPVKAVEVITEISVAGRAPKVQPALFALAVVASMADPTGQKAAFEAVPEVVRTASHLFTFVGYLRQFRGWGRAPKRAVAQWYQAKDPDALAYQMVKYRQRDGYSHRDLLRLTKPVAVDPVRNGLYAWAVGKEAERVPALVDAFRMLQIEDLAVSQVVNIIEAHPISWEMLPDRLLAEKDVVAALVDKGMPITALIRQLPRLTNLGLLTGARRTAVANRLVDEALLRKGRVHPLNLLVAQRTYASGHGVKGNLTWTPERAIVDALDAAFYAAFGTIEPTGKRTRLALDVSGSMGYALSNMPITAREGSAAMALVTANVEDDYDIVAFSDGQRGYRWGGSDRMLTPLTISPRQRLDDVVRTVSDLNFGRTDCALPMLDALDKGLEFDTFVIYTDNETWFGQMHPHQALVKYRQQTGIDARLVVVGMTATGFSIADPADPGMLDVVGFDTAAPNIISDFARGL